MNLITGETDLGKYRVIARSIHKIPTFVSAAVGLKPDTDYGVHHSLIVPAGLRNGVQAHQFSDLLGIDVGDGRIVVLHASLFERISTTTLRDAPYRVVSYYSRSRDSRDLSDLRLFSDGGPLLA